MNDVHRCFYEFIWQGKPDKISRKQMCQLYSEGGVKMTDIFMHSKSLKISWIRRFLSCSEKFTFHMFQSFFPTPYTSLQLFMGAEHYKTLALSMYNPFWKEVLLAFSDLTRLIVDDVACQSLWNNPKIQVNNSVIYFKSWCVKGVRFVHDILGTGGTFLSYFDFQRKYNVQVNFLQYHGLCNAIRYGFNNKAIPKLMEPTCIIPEALLLILKVKKGCAHIYNSLLKHKFKECKSLTKWKQQFDFDNTIWSFYYQIPFYSIEDVNLRWFQFKIVNRIIYMKDALLRFKLVTDNLCTFCKNNKETIMHIFCSCIHTNEIWSRLELWFSRNNVQIKISNQNKLFGFYGKNNGALNCIMIIVRKEIFAAKCKHCLPVFDHIMSEIKSYYDMEKYIFKTNLKEKKFIKRWSMLTLLY